MPNFQNDPVVSVFDSTNTPAVQGERGGNEGVRGVSNSAHGGVVGINNWPGNGSLGASRRNR